MPPGRPHPTSRPGRTCLRRARPGWARRAWAGPDGDGDAGLLSPQAAALFPVVLLLIMAIFQGVVFYQAQQHAQAAAAEGLRVARLYNGTAAAGAQEARLLLGQTGGDWLLTDPAVTATRTGDWAEIAVSGTAPSLIPGVSLHVARSMRGPVERYVPEAAP